MADRSISLIMPAYNEENTIDFSVNSACEKLRYYGFDYEIFIFDDGSAVSLVAKTKMSCIIFAFFNSLN